MFNLSNKATHNMFIYFTFLKTIKQTVSSTNKTKYLLQNYTAREQIFILIVKNREKLIWFLIYVQSEIR